MGEMVRITVRVDEWIKKEMDEHTDINWSKKIRDFLKKELRKEDIPVELKNLIDELKTGERWDILKAMFLYAVILDETGQSFKRNLSLMFGNAHEKRYGYKEIEAEVIRKLNEIGVTSKYDRVFGEKPFYEILESTLMNEGVIEHFESEVVKSLNESSEREELTKALYYIGQYMNFSENMERMSTCFPAKQLEIMFTYVFDTPKDLLLKLNKMGIIFYNYYESNAYSYEEYCVPIYSYDLIKDVTEKPDKYLLYEFIGLKSKLKNALLEERNREFLKFLKADFAIDFYNETKKIQDFKEFFDKNYGDNAFNETLATLVKSGMLVPYYWPPRRNTGRRSSMPEQMYYHLSPAARKYLYEIVFETLINKNYHEGELRNIIEVYEKISDKEA